MQLGKENCEQREELNFRKVEIVPFGEEQKIKTCTHHQYLNISRPCLCSTEEEHGQILHYQEHINPRPHIMTKCLV